MTAPLPGSATTDSGRRVRVSRRNLLRVMPVLGVAGCVAGHDVAAPPGRRVAADGVELRAVRSLWSKALPYLVLSTFDLPDGRHRVRTVLTDVRHAVLGLTASKKTIIDSDWYLGRGLTVQIGIGAPLLRRLGMPVPDSLRELPSGPRDRMYRSQTGGSLMVAVTATDQATAVATWRAIAKAGGPGLRTRWFQTGYQPQRAPGRRNIRNLLGMYDGIANPRIAPHPRNRVVEVRDSDHPWLQSGTYVVIRKIRIDLERWNSLLLERREETIGRRMSDGDLLHPDEGAGQELLSHVAVANKAAGGTRMLRRGYSFFERTDRDPVGGLIFMAYAGDVGRQIEPTLVDMIHRDALTPFLSHVGSEVFAIPQDVASFTENI